MRPFALACVLFAACAPQQLPDSDYEADSPSTGMYGIESANVGGQAIVTATALNLRDGPDTTHAVLLVMQHGTVVDVLASQNGWYQVNDAGTVGWCSGAFLAPVGGSNSGGGSDGGTTTTTPDAGGGTTGSDGGTAASGPIADALARAASGMGFSYHWGDGCWQPGSTDTGACYGSCPSCSHSGNWGADCSGFTAKVWQVPGPSALTTCSHPYSTVDFYNSHDHWSDVSRSNVKAADALVYHSGGGGHIFVYDSGDGWGWMKAYECKGCSYGCVHDTRTASSAYKGIRREGF